MIPTSPRLRLVLVSLLILSVAVVAAIKLGRVSEAKTQAPKATRVSGKQPVALKEGLALSQTVSARRAADNPKIINIQDGHDLTTGHIATALAAEGIDLATARSLALASDDLNNDGFPDLIAGYATTDGGFLMVYYGSERAF